MPMYKSINRVNFSTIDLLPASKNLKNLLIKYKILSIKHKFEHQATNMQFDILIYIDWAFKSQRL